MSESPVPPSSGGREPTMVSVVGSSSTDSWSSQPYASSQRIMVVDGNSIQESDVHSEDEEEEEALGVVDNITAQNFLQESDLMNAASSALGHKKSPSHDEDHLDTLLDGSAYHSGGLVPADLSPSSNSSASSLDLPSSGVGLPPVSTIIRPKSRFDAFCRPLIMGLPQFGTFDVMGDAASPMDAAAMASDRHVGIDDPVLDDSHMMGDGGGHSSVMDDSHSVLMDGAGVLGMDDGRMADGGGCIKGMADVLDKDSGLSDSEFGRFDPDMQAMEEMQKVTEHLPYLVNSDEVLHFMTSSASSVVDGGSYSQRPVSAIETNVIMSTSTGSKLSAADIKALEQRLRNSQQQVDGEHAAATNLRAVEVIIPDCIVTTQRSEGAYTNVVHSVLSQHQHQQESESNKILKAQGILRSTIIEKNLLPQVVVKTSSESTVITSTDHPKDNTNNQLITIKTTNSPSAITASVIQQLLRAQSPPKLRTTIPRGVITSVMSSSKADPQSILVAPAAAAELNGAKKDEKAAPKGKDGEHSVKEPTSKESAVVCSVLPSLFSNLSASALASLQSSLSSALPLTIQSSALGENSSAALGSPTLSSPPLSPILLPAGYGLLKAAAVKSEAGSGPLPPFTLVKQEPSSVSVSAAAVSSTPSPSSAARGIQPALSGDPAKPFRCTLCGKHLASKNVFQLHLRSHSGEKPFTCGLCGHHFSQKTSLTRHMRSHTGERPFPCDVCGKRFADKERIKIHMRTHTGEKPFACEVCGKRFSQKSTVKRHMSVHTGEKPFKCDACGKGFANRGNLNAHSKTHAST